MNTTQLIDNSVKNNGIVALPEATSSTGAIVMWNLSGTVDFDTLKAAWLAEGLDETWLPSMPTAKNALKRAIKDNTDRSFRHMVRSLDGRKGYASVDETATKDDLSYKVKLTAKLDAVQQPSIDPPDHPRAAAIIAAYYEYRDRLSHNHISGWLIDIMVDRLHAVACKHGGGVYYVPPSGMATLEKVTNVIHALTSCTIHLVPAMRAESTMRLVLESIIREVETRTDKWEADVAEGNSGADALDTKDSNARALEAKLSGYEALLGVKLTEMREKLGHLRAAIAAAILSTADDVK
jgi:hypothetical protein